MMRGLTPTFWTYVRKAEMVYLHDFESWSFNQLGEYYDRSGAAVYEVYARIKGRIHRKRTFAGSFSKGAPLIADDPGLRMCLYIDEEVPCQKMFNSQHAGQRRCPDCRAKAARRSWGFDVVYG